MAEVTITFLLSVFWYRLRSKSYADHSQAFFQNKLTVNRPSMGMNASSKSIKPIKELKPKPRSTKVKM